MAGDPGGIQTHDFQNRNLTFYSAELRGRFEAAKVQNFCLDCVPCSKRSTIHWYLLIVLKPLSLLVLSEKRMRMEPHEDSRLTDLLRACISMSNSIFTYFLGCKFS